MNKRSQMIPNRLGKLAKDQKGGLVLINPKGKAYAVDNDLSSLWLMLDGEKTYEELLKDLASGLQTQKKDMDPHVRVMLERLHSVELLEWRTDVSVAQ